MSKNFPEPSQFDCDDIRAMDQYIEQTAVFDATKELWYRIRKALVEGQKPITNTGPAQKGTRE